MKPFEQNLDKMMATWNTADPSEIQRLVDEAPEHNVHFVDPNHNIIGREAFAAMVAAMVAEVKAQIPGAVYSRDSAIGIQNNFCRYHWKNDFYGKRLMNGFDFAEINDAGKIVKVIGFFGALEPVG